METRAQADLAEQQEFLPALLGDGRRLLTLVGICLMLSGGFALFLAATQQLLPHDVAYLGVVAAQVCGAADGRILHFMFHDRAAFGGAVAATGLLYCWLAEFPLRQGQAWAWWVLVLSGILGFSSFLAYLGYGYFDSWHGTATAMLLPVFGLGLVRTYGQLRGPRHLRQLLRPAFAGRWATRAGLGRASLMAVGVGMFLAGTTIILMSMTRVFVPQDLHYLNLTVKQLMTLSPHLVPLIAHNRAGFGGALTSCGLALFLCVWCGSPSRSLWQVLALTGTVGFATAIGVHPLIGYTDFVHLAPAFAGLGLFVLGMWASYGAMHPPKKPVTLAH
ncbi:hypothetical protein [Hymenobacter properus]|uniref:Uncharacterized protein n=1 Tax=Hymenobacter properus TaxID=2791026 RepID=A0A931FI75_9BACT|nr:hypothetical protein [Hymenobacter properus]MBF9140473.1 hypothetical protein [Hymenobacter properus]MBR7719280.1 hypothetical protein [Microvirga sp. SRT04]